MAITKQGAQAFYELNIILSAITFALLVIMALTVVWVGIPITDERTVYDDKGNIAHDSNGYAITKNVCEPAVSCTVMDTVGKVFLTFLIFTAIAWGIYAFRTWSI